MPKSKTKSTTDKISWSAVKTKLTSQSPVTLLDLLQDLYSLSSDNQHFFHTRLGLGNNVLKPYKEVIERWMYPDVMRNQDVSVSKAKKAIADYKKAAGSPEHLAELMVFYCECATGFSDDVGYADEGFFDALVRMFELALNTVLTLPEAEHPALVERLRKLSPTCHNFGYGVGDDMDDLLAKHGFFR